MCSVPLTSFVPRRAKAANHDEKMAQANEKLEINRFVHPQVRENSSVRASLTWDVAAGKRWLI